jgi:hypothetical protein
MQGQKGYGTILLKNIGDDTLWLKMVKASCGCTIALVKNNHLAPSDTTVLSITFDSQKMDGHVEKEVTITSNDPVRPRIVVHFTVEVLTVFKTDPHAFIFLRCVKDSSYIKEMTLTNPSNDYTVSILAIEPKSEHLKVTAAKSILKPGESTQLTGKFRGTQDGFSRISIILTVDHPLQKQFEIIATAWVK